MPTSTIVNKCTNCYKGNALSSSLCVACDNTRRADDPKEQRRERDMRISNRARKNKDRDLNDRRY